jgi:hypothetical protein
MGPDAFGFALGVAVLATVVGLFGLISRIIAGPVASVGYTIGPGLARGVAAWVRPIHREARVRPTRASGHGNSSSTSGPDAATITELDPATAPRASAGRVDRPRTRLRMGDPCSELQGCRG